MMDDEERGYSIREVADRFAMEPSTLRYYEDMGLLSDVDRTPSGQRVYRQCHLNRLASICCFKHAGMSIADLKRFFVYEEDEATHIDDMLTLLSERHEAIDEQRRALEDAHVHVLRKLRFYGAIRDHLRNGGPAPGWSDYRDAALTD